MTTESVINDARSDALAWQAAARNRHGSDEPTTDEVDRDRARSLGCPGADVAVALLSVTGWAPIPLGDDLAPSGGPLGTYGDIHKHFRQRHADGVGLELGAKPGGVVLVAVHGTAKAWADWTSDVAVDRDVRNYEGRTSETATYKNIGRFVAVNWTPPPSTMRSTGVAVGREALNAAAEMMRPRRLGTNERGWCVWAAPPVNGRTLTFPARRKLGHGLEVLGEGSIVPWHAKRDDDGWTLATSGVPMADGPLPAWLIAELGGRWGKPRAA